MIEKKSISVYTVVIVKMLYREPVFWTEVSHITTRSFGSRNPSSFLAIITLTHILKADGGNVLLIPTGPFWGPLSYAFSTIRLHIRETRFHACPTELSFCHLWFQFSPSLWQKHTLISVGQHLRQERKLKKKRIEWIKLYINDLEHLKETGHLQLERGHIYFSFKFF